MTAGPGDETAGAVGGGHLRASHTDREQVIGTLKTAFVQGRLTKDELDVRLDQTFASRTCAELAGHGVIQRTWRSRSLRPWVPKTYATR